MKKLSALQIKITDKDREEMVKLTKILMSLRKKFELNDFLFLMTLENVLTGYKQEFGIHKILNVTKDKRVIDYEKYKRIAGIVQGLQESDVNIILFRDDPEVWFQYYLGLFLNKKTCIVCEERDFYKLDKLKETIAIVKVKSFSNKEELNKAVKNLLRMYETNF